MAATGIEGLLPYAINFSIVAGSALYFGRKPLAKFVYQRHERMKDLLESAAAAQEEAKKRFEAVMKSIENSDNEVSAILKETEADARAEAAAIEAKAQADADKVLSDAEKIVEHERHGQMNELKQKVIFKALTQAEVNLRKGINEDVHTQMLKAAKTQIEANA